MFTPPPAPAAAGKPSRRLRLLFAVVGAWACLFVGLIAELVFQQAHTAERLDDHQTRVLLFRSDIAQRLERAGAKNGDIQVSLAWNNINDVDLSVYEPSGEKIFYSHKHSATGGELDVDANASHFDLRSDPVENIYWPRGRAPQGEYRVYVEEFKNNGLPDPTPYQVVVIEKGRIHEFQGEITYGDGPRLIYAFTPGPTYADAGGLSGAFWRALCVVGLWGLGLGVSLAGWLLAGQWWLVKRVERRSLVGWKRAALILLGAAGLGFLAGALAQVLFELFPGRVDTPILIVLRLVCWLLLGGLTGFGVALLMPNLKRADGVRAGLWAGVFASFLFANFALGINPTSRLTAASLVGAFVGYMVLLVLVPIVIEEEPEEPEPSFVLAMEPLRLRGQRLSPTGSVRRRTR